MSNRTTGALVRLLRTRAGLTQEELAIRADLGGRTIREIESGRRQPRGQSLRLLADALGVPVQDLRGVEDETPPGIGCRLPADDDRFLGRAAEAARLTAVLSPAAGSRTGVPVAVVTGRPGVGKTALAVRVGHDLRDRFPDGQLYLGLGGDHPLDPAEALGRLLRAVGVEGPAVPPALEERAAEFRARLTGRRVLVLLDSAATEAQVRPLLPGTAGCAVLVTSRAPLTGLLGAEPVVVDVLDQDRSVQLLARVSGRDRVAAEPEAARRIARACGGLPLALRIAGARAAAEPELGLAYLADLLDDESRRLDELSAGDIAVRATFEVGYRRLDAVARRAYRRLGLLRTADVPAWAVGALLEVDEPAARAAIAQLVSAGLVDRHGRGPRTRIRMHDLVGLDARERAAAEPAADARAAVRRALSGWLALAAEADRRLPSGTMPLPGEPPTGWQPEPGLVELLLAEPLEWFEGERVALVDAVRQAADGEPALPAALVDSLIDFFATRHYPDDWATVARALHRSAESAGDRRLGGHALRRLAELQVFQSDGPAAEPIAREAVAECASAGDPVAEATARLVLGAALRISGRPADARPELELARAGLLAAGRDNDVAHIDRDLATTLLSLGDRAGARRHLRSAEQVLRRSGDLRGCGVVLSTLAWVDSWDGRPAGALHSAEQALELFRRIGDQRLGAMARTQVGLGQLETGDPEAAVRTLVEVLATSRDLRQPEVEAMSGWALAKAHHRLGDLPAARAGFDAARSTFATAGMPGWQGRAIEGLGDLAATEGECGSARRLWQQAAELLEPADPVRARAVRAKLAEQPVAT